RLATGLMSCVRCVVLWRRTWTLRTFLRAIWRRFLGSSGMSLRRLRSLRLLRPKRGGALMVASPPGARGSDSKLSDVARHLGLPSGLVSTSLPSGSALLDILSFSLCVDDGCL